MSPFSTEQVAQRVGVNRVTLERWLSSGKVERPKTIHFGRAELRYWTAKDIKQIEKYKATHYRKGRGRKKGKKS